MARGSAGRAPVGAATRALAFGAVLLTGGVVTAVVLAATGSRPDVVALVAGSVAVALGHHASVRIVPGPDAHRSSLDELVAVALVLVDITLVPWAVLGGLFLATALAPVLGVQDRVRHPSPPKAVFNAGSLLAGTLVTYTVARLLAGTGVPLAVAAVPAGLTHSAVQALLIMGVVSVSQGGSQLDTVRGAARDALGANIATVLGGVTLGLVVNAFDGSAVWVGLTAVGVYLWSRWTLREHYDAHTDAHVRAQLPTALLALELDDHLTSTASLLVGAGRVEIRPAPPEPEEIGARIDDAMHWLVAAEPTSIQGKFTEEDRDLLMALADAVRPARRQASAFSALESDSRTARRLLGDHAATANALTLDAVERHGELLHHLISHSPQRPRHGDLARVLEELRTRAPHVVSVASGPPVSVVGDPQLLRSILETGLHDIVLPSVPHPVVWWRHEHREVVVAIEDADQPLDGLRTSKGVGSSRSGSYADRLVHNAVHLLGGRVVTFSDGSHTVALHLHLPVATPVPASQDGAVSR